MHNGIESFAPVSPGFLATFALISPGRRPWKRLSRLSPPAFWLVLAAWKEFRARFPRGSPTFAPISPGGGESARHLTVSDDDFVDELCGGIKHPDRFDDFRAPFRGGVRQPLIVRLHLGQNPALRHFGEGFAD